jgi:hypothetical protein
MLFCGVINMDEPVGSHMELAEMSARFIEPAAIAVLTFSLPLGEGRAWFSTIHAESGSVSDYAS